MKWSQAIYFLEPRSSYTTWKSSDHLKVMRRKQCCMWWNLPSLWIKIKKRTVHSFNFCETNEALTENKHHKLCIWPHFSCKKHLWIITSDRLTREELRIYCNLTRWSSWVSTERKKNIHQQSPLVEKQTKCARLKAMASEIVILFLPMDYSWSEARKGGELDGASVIWGRVQLGCCFTWLSEPIWGRPPWASPLWRSG